MFKVVRSVTMLKLETNVDLKSQVELESGNTHEQLGSGKTEELANGKTEEKLSTCKLVSLPVTHLFIHPLCTAFATSRSDECQLPFGNMVQGRTSVTQQVSRGLHHFHLLPLVVAFKQVGKYTSHTRSLHLLFSSRHR